MLTVTGRYPPGLRGLRAGENDPHLAGAAAAFAAQGQGRIATVANRGIRGLYGLVRVLLFSLGDRCTRCRSSSHVAGVEAARQRRVGGALDDGAAVREDRELMLPDLCLQ